MASLAGLHQNRLSDYKTGKHKPKEISVFAAFADGLGLPSAARRALGLDTVSPGAAGIGVPSPRPAPFAEASLEYPASAAQAAENVASLWQADLADQGVLVQGRIEPAAWQDASLGWLVGPFGPAEADLPGGVRVGLGDVEPAPAPGRSRPRYVGSDPGHAPSGHRHRRAEVERLTRPLGETPGWSANRNSMVRRRAYGSITR